MYNSQFVFLMTKNDIIVHHNKFSNWGVYHANLPNLKDPRAPSQNFKKIPVYISCYFYSKIGGAVVTGVVDEPLI